MKTLILSFTTTIIALLMSQSSYSDQTIINNNSAPPATQQNNCSQPAPTDPRVPPAGSYTIDTGNGSSQQLYTTGETKPYIVDNSCNNNNASPIIQPYVNAPPIRPRR